MTDVAAVSGQTKAPAGASASKATGKASGAGSVLDGAFAAIFGKAADGAAVDGKGAAVPGTDPAQVAGAPMPALIEGEGLEASGETVATDIDAAAGKPRKPGARGKTPVEQVETLGLTVQTTAPAVVPPAQEFQAPVAGKAKSAPGIDAVATLGNKPEAAALANASEDPSAALKALTADGKPIAETFAKDLAAAPAPVPAPPKVDAQQVAANANVTSQQADQSTPDGSGKGEKRGGHEKIADMMTYAEAANDDAALAGVADPLRDIVQSLPPVIQSQLSVAGPSGAGSTTSTGELLSNHAIDMSVSGQWIDRMAREISTLAEGTGHARFQLNPPNLGRIQVELWQGDDKMNLRLLAETDEAARRLRDGQGALEAHARVGALSLGSVSVEKASAPLDSGKEQNQRQPADSNSSQQQANTQAQGQSAQGRGNFNSSTNRAGLSAVMGPEREGEPTQGTRTSRAGDPRVRFA